MKTPQLRICVTSKCNLKCRFCRSGGEGYNKNLEDIMSCDEIKKVLCIAKDVGFQCVKFTGGEPLLRKDIFTLIKIAKNLGYQDVQMVTNGTLLENNVELLKKVGIDLLTVSLDGIECNDYKFMRGYSVEPVLKGIKKCSEVGLPVRINTVLIKRNCNQLDKLISFSRENNCSLKLLDLIRFDSMDTFFKEQYLNFDYVRKYLESQNAKCIGMEEAPGGIGAPLREYRFADGLQVVIKDSTQGTFYHETCKKCDNYPCQDALISVRVTHDGKLKRCLIRDDNLVDIMKHIRANDLQKAKELTKNIFDIMVGSKYIPFKWKVEKYI